MERDTTFLYQMVLAIKLWLPAGAGTKDLASCGRCVKTETAVSKDSRQEDA